VGLSRHRPCEGEREWISRALDGELSEFEGVLLDAHLERCAECRAFYADAHGFTTALRAAPLESPETPLRVVSEHRSPRRLVPAIHIAAAACVAAALFLTVGSLPQRTESEVAAPPAEPAGLSGTVPSVNEYVIGIWRDDLAARRLAILPKDGTVKPPLLA
jgi:ferric-dicitrate binding protein FerR (iron transport regulator)